MSSHLLTPEQVAERLALSLVYTRRLMARGDIRVTRIGRLVRCTEESVAEFIADRTATSTRSSRRGSAA